MKQLYQVLPKLRFLILEFQGYIPWEIFRNWEKGNFFFVFLLCFLFFSFFINFLRQEEVWKSWYLDIESSIKGSCEVRGSWNSGHNWFYIFGLKKSKKFSKRGNKPIIWRQKEQSTFCGFQPKHFRFLKLLCRKGKQKILHERRPKCWVFLKNDFERTAAQAEPTIPVPMMVTFRVSMRRFLNGGNKKQTSPSCSKKPCDHNSSKWIPGIKMLNTRKLPYKLYVLFLFSAHLPLLTKFSI